MNIDLSKYKKMRDDGASPLDVGKQMRTDGIAGIEFFKTLRNIFPQLSLEDTKKLNILSSGRTLDEWGKSISQALEEISKDATDKPES